MDLNQTTTISRRKTFTVPVPLGRVSSNQTFTAGGGGDPMGDLTINLSQQSSSKVFSSNKIASENTTEDMPLKSTKSILGDSGQLWKLTETDSLVQDEDINDLLLSLVNLRNSRNPSFEVKKGLNVTGTVEDKPEAELDKELEYLRQQEHNLKEDVNKEASKLKALEERTKAEEEKDRVKVKEYQRKILRNIELRTEKKAESKELLEEIKNVTLMTKDLVDRLNYPKAIIRKLLKVSNENTCQDEDFCRQFSGGKCLADTNMENE